MHRDRRPSAVLPILAAALLAAGSLTGCEALGLGGSGGAPSPTTTPLPTPDDGTLLPEGTTELLIESGETVQVDLGEGSQGVGDMWGVVSQTNENAATVEVVLGEKVFGTPHRDPSDTPAPPGSSTRFAVEITGREPGTSTVRVLYCARAEIAEGCDQSTGTKEAPVDPVEITVTVT